MRGDKKVVEQLNLALKGELTAIVQYMVQSELCGNWGYGRLADVTKGRAIEEMKHAEALIERIVFFDSVPDVKLSLSPTIGSDVPQQFEAGLADEISAAREYNQAVEICREAGDSGTRELFERLLHDEERHVDFLESQLHSLKEAGLGPYLAEQMKK